jgi:hypothetical protein
MKIYKINIDLKNKIWEWLKKNNIANRGEFDGNKENQLVGLIGEYEVHNLLLGYYPEFKNSFDGGIDIIYKNKSIDVKTMGRTVDAKLSYINNFVSSQIKYDCDILVFVSINKKQNTFQICGYINKEDLEIESMFYEKGEKRYRDDGTFFILKTDTYEIYNYNLIDTQYINEI